MKVLIINSYNKVNARLRYEINALEQAGYDTTILLWNKGNVDEKQLNSQEEDEMNIQRVNLRAPAASWALLFYLPIFFILVAKHVYRKGYDVLHCTHPSILPICILLQKIKDLKVVYDAFEFHNIGMFESLPSFLQFSFSKKSIRWLEQEFVKGIDGILTIDSKDDFLLESYKKNNANTKVLLNVPSLKDKGDPPSGNRPSESSVFTLAGGLSERKGLDKTIESVAMVQKVHPDFKLQLIGSLRDRSLREFKTLLRKHEVLDTVDYMHWVPYLDLLGYLNLTQGGIIPYQKLDRYIYSRGNSRKLFTYMHASLPVIAPEFSGVSEIVNRSKCGLNVDTTKSEEIAEGIIYLLDNPSIADTLGKNGRKAIENQYNWESEREKLVTFYSNLENDGTLSFKD